MDALEFLNVCITGGKPFAVFRHGFWLNGNAKFVLRVFPELLFGRGRKRNFFLSCPGQNRRKFEKRPGKQQWGGPLSKAQAPPEINGAKTFTPFFVAPAPPRFSEQRPKKDFAPAIRRPPPPEFPTFRKTVTGVLSPNAAWGNF